MSDVPNERRVVMLHDAVRRGDLPVLEQLLAEDASLANALSVTDPRKTYPLHVAAEFASRGSQRAAAASDA
jgi:hypothetical protein